MWVENRKDEFEKNFTELLNEIYLHEKSSMAIISSYFAFTTLSTVGLGDLVPINNDEYIFMCVNFLFGVLCFSYIKTQFSETLIEIRNLEPQIE